jgi:ketopantoate reductase
MYNAAISPLTSAGGLENAALLKPGKLRTLFFQFLLENHAILKASNQPMGTIGPFHPDKVAWLLNHKWLGESMAPFFRPSLKKTYCSMFHDVIGGATEIENYNGYLSRLAKTSKSPSPLNDIALNVIKQMASERSMGNAHWLKALLDAF